MAVHSHLSYVSLFLHCFCLLLHQRWSFFFGSVEFPQLFQLFPPLSGDSNQGETKPLPVLVVQWQMRFPCVLCFFQYRLTWWKEVYRESICTRTEKLFCSHYTVQSVFTSEWYVHAIMLSIASLRVNFDQPWVRWSVIVTRIHSLG